MAQSNIDILEKFKKLKALLTQRETPISSFYLSKQLNISPLESSCILNEFLLQEENALSKYIIIFQVEQMSNTAITIKIIPSYSGDLESTLTSKDTISFSTFAIMNKTSTLSLKDYNMLIVPNEIESRYDFGAIQLPNSKPKPIISTTKEEMKSILNNNNNEKPKTSGKQQLNKPINSKRQDNNFNDVFYSKLTVMEQDGENMYGGYKPKNQEDDDGKRKNNLDLDTQVHDLKKLSKQNASSFSKANIIETNSHLQEQDDQSCEMDIDDNDTNNHIPIEPKKILKTRKVMKTITKANEKGYMVTSDEWIEEEYWSDEKATTKAKQIFGKAQPVQANKKGKKAAANQSSIFSFFAK